MIRNSEEENSQMQHLNQTIAFEYLNQGKKRQSIQMVGLDVLLVLRDFLKQ